jgi:Cu2+-exporting ATPase
MRCAACAWLIDRALAREPGVIEAGANAITGRIRIAWDPQRTRLSRSLQLLSSLGYRPYLASGEARERARRSERNRWLLRIGVAGLGAMQTMMFAEAAYFDSAGSMPLPTRDFLRWVTFLVATPVVFYSGWTFIEGMWRELVGRRPGMDTLIATSVLLAWAASVFETIRGGPHVWFDAAAMFVFLLLVARMLEQRARNIASAQVDAMARARPAFAIRERPDGRRESVPLGALAIGDIVCVAIGDAVPADGELIDASASFEEALLTGESQPVMRHAGEPVHAGTLCRERPARIRATAVGSATRLSQIARLVEQAQSHRPPLARIAERIASRFVVALLFMAILVYCGWRIHDPQRAFEVTLSLLAISCPCALSLSVPAALATAHGALARIGVLALRPDALDRLARASDVVFDKTGTLTDGRPVVVQVAMFDDGIARDDALRIAAALERDSGHPIAVAFAAFDDGTTACDVASAFGLGMQGVVDGRYWRLGKAGFATDDADDGHLWLGDGHAATARFTLREIDRDDARAALDALRAQGLAVHLASGDGDAAVERIAARLGIADARARQTPEAKLAGIRALQAQGRVVAMIGDGINDAPVLAGADVSIAMGSGAALAHRSADLVLGGTSLAAIPATIDLARRTRRIIRENLAWALGYNLLALPLAILGFVTPWLAALGMALSSLVVTLNALRLGRRMTP